MRRSLIAILAAFMLAALVPSAALAAKPQPSITVNCTAVTGSSPFSWAVSGTASWTGAPGGTIAVPFAQVSHPPYLTVYDSASFSTVPGKTGSMTITAVWVQYSTAYAVPGDSVDLGIHFVAKNGSVKGVQLATCGALLPGLSE